MRHAFRFLVLLVVVLPATAVAQEEPEVHWAFRKPTRPEPPSRDSLKQAARVRNPIDHAHALSKLCLTLFNLSEFAFVD